MGQRGFPMAASQKLSHLLQLADQGPSLRAALAAEVAALRTDWPADYPESVRQVCEALLAKAASDVDPATRARLRVQLYSDPELAARVLPRQSTSQIVIQAARGGDNVAISLATGLGVDVAIAR